MKGRRHDREIAGHRAQSRFRHWHTKLLRLYLRRDRCRCRWVLLKVAAAGHRTRVETAYPDARRRGGRHYGQPGTARALLGRSTTTACAVAPGKPDVSPRWRLAHGDSAHPRGRSGQIGRFDRGRALRHHRCAVAWCVDATGAIGGLLRSHRMARPVGSVWRGAGGLRMVHGGRGGRAANAERPISPARSRCAVLGHRSGAASSVMAQARCPGARRWGGRAAAGQTTRESWRVNAAVLPCWPIDYAGREWCRTDRERPRRRHRRAHASEPFRAGMRLNRAPLLLRTGSGW